MKDDLRTTRVVRVAVPVPLPGTFDYLLPAGKSPEPGQRVLVPFGGRDLVGVLIETDVDSSVPAERLQAVHTVLDGARPVLTPDLMRLLQWCADYYKHPLGEVMSNALPPTLRQADRGLPDPPVQWRLSNEGRAYLERGPGRAPARFRVLEALASGPLTPSALREAADCSAAVLRGTAEADLIRSEPVGGGGLHVQPGPELNMEQVVAVDAISEELDKFACHLLDGITGSGKTEVYLKLAERVLSEDRQVLILVPEIGLTPQLLRRFQERLGIEPVVTHSGVAPGERARAWAAALRGEARLFIGTRSALFLPLERPGLMIMDEAHDPSFKQQDGFRYAGADLAVKRAHDLGIPIVLGTATPTLESLLNAERGRFHHHRLRERATGASPPTFQLVDQRQQASPGGISPVALEALADTLARGEQALVFLNRRGYAPVLLCHDCGWHAGCGNCDANLTWHRARRNLQCHHCGVQQGVPRFCPDCGADALQGAGEGTEQIEQMLGKHFPEVPLHRVDRDRVRRKGELETVVDAVRGGDPCILVGTQMLAKGHHFPRVTLVVIVNLDQALYSADFRAMERMAQLLVQVAGRAGREQRPGTVLLQTHHPEHEGLHQLLREGYESFAQTLLAERALADLPPYSHQATLRAEALDRDMLLQFLEEARAAWSGKDNALFGPFPAMMERRGGRLRWYLLLQTPDRRSLQRALDEFIPRVRALSSARKVRWTIDLDPQEF